MIAGCDPSTMTSMTAGLLPEWATFTVKADSDALELESISPPPAKPVGPTSDRTSDLSSTSPPARSRWPHHDYGATLQQAIDLYKSQPCFKDAFAQLEKSADLAGGLDAILGWIGDRRSSSTAPTRCPRRASWSRRPTARTPRSS